MVPHLLFRAMEEHLAAIVEIFDIALAISFTALPPCSFALTQEGEWVANWDRAQPA